MSLASLSITELRKQLTAGEITPLQIIDDIEKAILASDSEINAYLSIISKKPEKWLYR